MDKTMKRLAFLSFIFGFGFVVFGQLNFSYKGLGFYFVVLGLILLALYLYNKKYQ